MAPNSLLALHYQQFIQTAQDSLLEGDFAAAFTQLEHAHILGQCDLLSHWAVYCWMLWVAIAQRNFGEIAG